MENENCYICGLSLKDNFCHKLPCDHIYHYECIMNTFIHTRRYTFNYHNQCPYCLKDSGYLPIVNGLKKLNIGVHVATIQDSFNIEIKNTLCKAILKTGKNKGNKCNKKCALGYEYCKRHKQ